VTTTFKVANVISSFNAESGGPPGTVSLIAEAGRGHWQADLFTTDYRQSPSDTLLVADFPGQVNLLPAAAHGVMGGLAMLAGVSRVYRDRLLRGGKPDVVHIHGMWSPFLAAFALTARRHGIPYIISPHGMLEPWSLTVRSLRKSLALHSYQGHILGRAAALHATSDMEADNLRRVNGRRVPIFVVPNPVAEPSHAAGHPAGHAPAEPAAQHPRVLLFLSRIHEKKGLNVLLQAWNETRPAGWRLLIVGSGEEAYVASLKRYCADHAVPDVEFKRHVEAEQRQQVFMNASAFILPSYSENFGNVVAEALIHGLPVITTTGTPWSSIVANRCGWYVAPTLDALKLALAEATSSDAHTLEAMGARGRAYVTANFTLPAVRHGLLAMYRAAIGMR
jgi:glycosyltransferase involved in cell wall biosynthesis